MKLHKRTAHTRDDEHPGALWFSVIPEIEKIASHVEILRVVEPARDRAG